jgi:hypothetical protein
MSTIEEKLWTRLTEDSDSDRALAVHQRPPQRNRSRRVSVAVGAASLTGVTLALVLALTGSSNTTSAYAVTVNPDGSVSVTLTEVLGVSGANEALARLGVRARIAQIEAGCTQTGARVRWTPGNAHEQQEQIVEPQKDGEGLAGINMIIHPTAIPTGDTALIAAQLDPSTPPVPASHGKPVSSASWTVGLYRGVAPTCQPPATIYPG